MMESKADLQKLSWVYGLSDLVQGHEKDWGKAFKRIVDNAMMRCGASKRIAAKDVWRWSRMMNRIALAGPDYYDQLLAPWREEERMRFCAKILPGGCRYFVTSPKPAPREEVDKAILDAGARKHSISGMSYGRMTFHQTIKFEPASSEQELIAGMVAEWMDQMLLEAFLIGGGKGGK